MNTEISRTGAHRPDGPLMQIPVKALDQIYCGSCHLATPTWRQRCIHCRELLHVEPRNFSQLSPAMSTTTDRA